MQFCSWCSPVKEESAPPTARQMEPPPSARAVQQAQEQHIHTEDVVDKQHHKEQTSQHAPQTETQEAAAQTDDVSTSPPADIVSQQLARFSALLSMAHATAVSLMSEDFSSLYNNGPTDIARLTSHETASTSSPSLYNSRSISAPGTCNQLVSCASGHGLCA